MKATVRTGPKRRRRVPRDQRKRPRRWGSTVGNFKREREARLLAIADRDET